MTTPPTVDELPVAPSRGDAPTTFRTRADAFLSALATFRSQLVALGSWTEATAGEVDADAQAVETARAQVVALEAAAQGHKDDAEAAADASAVSANATAWVSGGSYTQGDVRWSLLNFASYRAKTTHSGLTTDPRDDTTNWSPVLTLSQATDATFLGDTTFDGSFTEPPYNMAGTVLDPANGTLQYKVLSATVMLTESLTEGQSVMLRIAGGATHGVTWPVDKWAGGAAPSLTANDVVVIWKEGGVVYGTYLGSVA